MNNSIPKEHAEMILETLKIKNKMSESSTLKAGKEMMLKAKEHTSTAHYDYKDLKYKMDMLKDFVSFFSKD
ncbi:MAG: hypothetical protein JXR88_07635 [Clostridia bacterium]|nr:hypothetical protein [Clostridia bacterium]